MKLTRPADTSETVEERDRRLLHAWQGGDLDSGAKLLRVYQPLFFQLCARRGIRSTDDLLDLQGEMVLGLCNQLDRLWIRTGFATCVHWAWKSAFKRFLARRRSSEAAIDFDSCEDTSKSRPEDEVEREELVEIIIACAESLDAVEFEIFSARVLEKKPYAEIESRVDLRGGALRTCYHRTIQKLRDCIRSKGREFFDGES